MTNPTAALLWAASRPTVEADAVARALADGADLALAADVAVAQRVSPLLHRALTAAGVTAVPATLEHDAQRCRAQSRLLLPQIGPLLLRPLADAGLAPLVIKGAALAPRYPDPGLRPMDDVDIIVAGDGVDATVAALNATGWATHTPPQRRTFEVDLTHPSLPGLHVDLHRQLASWRTRASRLTSEMLWESRRAAELYGAPAFVVPPELELVMLAAHAAKPYHGFDRLIWVVDVAVVAAHGLDWDRVDALATHAHARVAVAVALTLAARLGVDAPAHLRSIDTERTRVLAPLLSPDAPTALRDGEVRTALRYALVDDRRTRAALVVSELFDKNLRDVPVRAARLLRRRFK